MNERGVAVLVKAALDGRNHGRGAYLDPVTGARCAMGFLCEAAGLTCGTDTISSGPHDLWADYDLRHEKRCPECGALFLGEAGLIVHGNDTHGWDLLTIARKLGPDSV